MDPGALLAKRKGGSQGRDPEEAILTDTVHGPPSPQPSFLPERATLFATYALAMLLFFRVPLLSGFDLGFGDRGDGLIEIAILEHWRNVLTGYSHWATTGYFHPYTGTLGYNDGYFLFGLVYSFWRLFADPFLADTLNVFTFKTIGFFAAYHLVSRSLGWGHRSGLFVALMFTIASGLAAQVGHAQLHIIALLPLAMTLVIAIVRAERAGQRMRSRIAAVGLAALLAAWLMTAYYLAWFGILFSAIYVLFYVVLALPLRPRTFLRAVRPHILTALTGLLAFSLFLIPFFVTYLPKQRETGGHGYWDHAFYQANPIDLINVGADNYLWGWIFRLFHSLFSNRSGPAYIIDGEHVSGFPLLLFFLILVAAGRVLAGRGAVPGQPVAPELRALALALIMSWLLTLRLFGHSLWWLVYEAVPGASGIRVVLRYQLFLILPALLLVAAAYRTQAQRLIRTRPMLTGALLALLVGEQLNGASVAQLSRSLHRTALWAVPAPPPACRVFYVVATRRAERFFGNESTDSLYPHNVDAMFLAERWRLPTINGFSTFNPPDWQFAYPLAADYDQRVATYAQNHKLRGLCRLDMRETRPWKMMPDPR
ncbi:hypothetical protein [Sphingomonas sp. ERG5]|uniref:hypothetical protein n=1 Tax=Sphingomonas sp. ERG5 TaxID=1381597 RepID=UPI000A750BC4|nr:hypothetical protein [Sphingomonas sp. ERG5]